MRHILVVATVALTLTACGPTDRKAVLESSTVGAARAAGPGDTVMDFRVSRPLPNAFGGADIFGRTTNAGRVLVRFLGGDGRTAHFQRSDLMLESSATTMNQTPLVIPHVSRTTVSGVAGGRPVAGSIDTTSYEVVGPRPTTEVATTAAPIRLSVSAGQSVSVEGHVLRVLEVTPTSVSYRID